MQEGGEGEEAEHHPLHTQAGDDDAAVAPAVAQAAKERGQGEDDEAEGGEHNAHLELADVLVVRGVRGEEGVQEAVCGVVIHVEQKS